MRWIRTAAKAVIVREGRILLLRCRDESGEWHALPGGGQEPEERLEQTVVRECLEEIGARVRVGRLLFVRDFIVRNHDFSYVHEAPHQIEHGFECFLEPGEEPRVGHTPDDAQEDVVWLHPAELRRVRVYPERLRELLDPMRRSPLPVYWGDAG